MPRRVFGAEMRRAAESVPEGEAAGLVGRAWAGEACRRLAADYAGERGRKGLELAGEVEARDALGDYGGLGMRRGASWTSRWQTS